MTWGLFGWFECEHDPEAACALLDAAQAWLRERGRDPHGRADGLHDQRRERPAGRGSRASSNHPQPSASPLLPGSLRAAGRVDAAERTPQKDGEMGWTLEVNEPMSRALEGMRAEIKRRYRMYEQDL
jgi:hypothetical protein